MGHSKNNAKRKVPHMQELIKEKERANINNLSQFRELEKDTQREPKASRRKEGNNKLRTEMHKFE